LAQQRLPTEPGRLEHLIWERLPDVAPRRTRPNRGGERPPIRTDANSHGAVLSDQLTNRLSETEDVRRAAGVDPARLQVLELGFLNSAEREILERLGLQVLSEEEVSEALAEAYYRVELRFENEGAVATFRARDHSARGVTQTYPVRSSSGAADPLRLACRFSDRAEAVAFYEDRTLASEASFAARSPSRVSEVTRYRLLIQFPDPTAIEVFRRELEQYRTGTVDQSGLTYIQRRQLFDALEQVSAVGPEHRLGERLRAEGAPDTEGYFDVDLWHPGLEDLTHEARQQFRSFVETVGGTVTDGPTTVAQSLLLARVRVGPVGLQALLRYDRVAYIDLPPKLVRPEFSAFSPIEVPTDLPTIPEDGPLACVIDSGVVAGHPLLRGVVIEERDFDSGEGMPVDLVGHGTHTSGIVVYGDLPRHLAASEWRPQVRLLSAKVLRRSEHGDWAEFGEQRHAVSQLREAITYFAQERGCRVFNLSIGHSERRYIGGRQLPWALALDELARTLDVVIVVSAGNVVVPAVPEPLVADQFQAKVREQLFTPDHALIDPATAAIALTVGSVARGDAPFDNRGFPGERPRLAGAPADCPSPFTRAGLLDSTGRGLGRAVKPELVDYGGNYALDVSGRRWSRNDPQLGEVSLRHDFALGGPLTAQSGTSAAAPHVAHCCAVVEATLRQQAPENRRPSANLIRALVVHAARRGQALEQWISHGFGGSDAESRLLRVVGYGRTDPNRAGFSEENRSVLIAEDEVREDHFHLYELELPDEFVSRPGRRTLRVSLAYDPPVRGTRREYLSRTMWFQVYRGLASSRIMEAMGRAAGSGEMPTLPNSNVVRPRPPHTALQWSTVQSAVFGSGQERAFDYRDERDGRRLIHILVGCIRRFDAGTSLEQRYALVTSIEHEDSTVRLHQALRQQIELRARQRVRLTI
jgi:hypothetical protein